MIIGFMLDSARCLESRSYYRRFIDFTAQRGMNTLLWHFSDDQGCSLRFDSLPQAASPNAYDKSEMRELVAYARERGVMLIPELASLGHTRYLTGLPAYADLAESDDYYSSLCPVSPRTHELVSQLLGEVLEIFDAPLVHVGLDEINIGHHPLTRAALEQRTTGELFAEHVNRLHRQLSAAGRRMMMWADQILADPSIALPGAREPLPRDILLCNWQYDPDACPSTTRQLLEWGFDVIACPALISHHQPIYPGESYAAPNVRALATHRALSPAVRGIMTTIWTPTRFLADALWPAIHYAAAAMTDGQELDHRDTLARFARGYHDFEAPQDWLDAMVELHQHAPCRQPWTAVLKLDASKLTSGLDLGAEATRFERIRAALHARRSSVQRNAGSYESLLLLADVLAHVWHRAWQWRQGRGDAYTLQCSEHLLERLGQAWDEHRFGDDPRKHECRHLYDSGDHLLIAFGEGTQVLRQALESTADFASCAAGT